VEEKEGQLSSQHIGMPSPIPLIILQTSPCKPEAHVVEKIHARCPGYEYRHYTDSEICTFFADHPLSEFPDIEQRFHDMPTGPHKSDLFRYYFLYIHGGIYLDSDAMINKDIHTIAGEYSFFSVLSHHCQGDVVFQGLLGSTPGNEIIYRALQDAYTVSLADLNSCYHLLCRNLHRIIHAREYPFSWKLFEEQIWTDECFHRGYSCTYNDDREVILTHFCVGKIVPINA